MNIKQIRNATLIIEYASKKFLIYPVFADKGTYPPFPNSLRQDENNPLVDLPVTKKEQIDVDDVIVTPKWLEQMLEALYSSEKVGAVGPVTNYAHGQEITVTYQNEAEMVSFASEVTEKFKNKWSQKTKLIGFCLLFKKSVLEEVGVLDELFSPGNYEDDDISFRILLAGYKLLLCHNIFDLYLAMMGLMLDFEILHSEFHFC